jgi:hypothetical protein
VAGFFDGLIGDLQDVNVGHGAVVDVVDGPEGGSAFVGGDTAAKAANETNETNSDES